MSGPYFNAANNYRKHGWLGALPLPPGEKNPPPTGFTGSGRPHPEAEQINAWLMGKDADRPWAPDGNIALRLAEVPSAITNKRTDLPFAYAGNNVDGWELIGIDVDDYGKKVGLAELRELEAELGALPPTAISTARWSIWGEHRTGIRVFLVPKGYRYMGKAGTSIDIVQKRHRFMVAYPSTNPDAPKVDGKPALYEWRWGATDTDEPEGFDDGIPDIAQTGGPAVGKAKPEDCDPDIALLPEAWFDHLSRGGQAESNDPISDLTDDELFDWAQTLSYGEEPCRRMQKVVEKHLEILANSASSHDKIAGAHWEIFNLAAEGHAGLGWALDNYHPAWRDHVVGNRGDIESASGELNRSALGALDKIQPLYKGLSRPEDTCAVDASAFDVGGWADRVSAEDEAAIAAGDNGGLGPIVGKMELLAAKPANEYGQHDDGNGQHFIDLYGASVKYVDGRGSWVAWDGTRWHRDVSNRNVSLAFRRVRENQESYGAAAVYEGKQNDDKEMIAHGRSWLTWSRRSGNVGPIKNALESAERLHVEGETVAVPTTIFDSRVDLLGCANGVLELTEDPDLRAPRKEDYVTFNTNVDYVPWRVLANSEGETLEGYQLWTEYLNTFLPDPETQRYIQKVLGHLIIGENPEKRMVFLYGPHDTGKSTMISALKSALGDYYGAVDIALFKHKDLNPGLIRACPMRVVGLTEVDEGSMDAAVVKRLTGNDYVTAEAKYSNEIFQGRPQFTVVIGTNNPPNIKHADEALKERLLVLPFLKSIERKQRRYERSQQIESHSGIAVLSWLIEGWKLYAAEGLTGAPEVVKKLQQDMVAGLNTTQKFISENLEKAEDSVSGNRALRRAQRKAAARDKAKPGVADLDLAWTPKASVVYEIYVRWCVKNGVLPVSNPELTKDLGLGTPQVKKIDGKSARCYYGVRVKQIEEDAGVSGWKPK